MIVVTKHNEHGRALLDGLLVGRGTNAGTRGEVASLAALIGGTPAEVEYRTQRFRMLRDREPGVCACLSNILARKEGGKIGYEVLTVVVPTAGQIIDAGQHKPKDTSAAVSLNGCRTVAEGFFKAAAACDSSHAFLKVWGGDGKMRAEVVRLLGGE